MFLQIPICFINSLETFKVFLDQSKFILGPPHFFLLYFSILCWELQFLTFLERGCFRPLSPLSGERDGSVVSVNTEPGKWCSTPLIAALRRQRQATLRLILMVHLLPFSTVFGSIYLKGTQLDGILWATDDRNNYISSNKASPCTIAIPQITLAYIRHSWFLSYYSPKGSSPRLLMELLLMWFPRDP